MYCIAHVQKPDLTFKRMKITFHELELFTITTLISMMLNITL